MFGFVAVVHYILIVMPVICEFRKVIIFSPIILIVEDRVGRNSGSGGS